MALDVEGPVGAGAGEPRRGRSPVNMPPDENLSGYQDVTTGSREAPIARDRAGFAIDSAPELKTLVGLAVAVTAIAALYFGKDVLIPITLAIMLSFVLSPVVDLLQRLRLWRAPAVVLAVLAALSMFGLIGTLIGTQAASLTADAPRYAQTIESKVQGVQAFAMDRAAAITKALGADRKRPPPVAAPTLEGTGTTVTTVTTSTGREPRRPILVEVAGSETSPFVVARTILQPILGPLETTVIVLIVAIFVLMQKEDLRDRFIRLLGSSDLHRTTLAMDDAGKRLSRYFLSQLAVNTCFGLVIGLGLWAIGLPAPAMWGILAGLLRFVPYIGSFLAAVAPIALGAAIDPGWSMALYVAILFVVVEPLTGYVVEPLLYGHSTGLSPISVIVAAIFWTWIWGPIGLILSTPLTLCLVVMGRHVKSLEFFDVLLGDRPALSAVESFYQRILANNPDEALAQAETLLADRSLAEYYDGVVLQGLKLAAGDEARGTIDQLRLGQMAKAMRAVIGDLEEHVGDAAPVEEGGAIACISGSGPFDDAVTAMLAQLFAQRGAAVRRIRHDAVSREAIGLLDLSGVSVIVLSYLELSGSPAQLRYLIKRLRQRAPQAAIVAGLWPEGEPMLRDGELQRALGADAYVASLALAVEAALAEPGAAARAA